LTGIEEPSPSIAVRGTSRHSAIFRRKSAAAPDQGCGVFLFITVQFPDLELTDFSCIIARMMNPTSYLAKISKSLAITGLFFGLTANASAGLPHDGLVRLSAAVQTDSEQRTKDLAEATELTRTVVTLYGARKYDEAMPKAVRALELRGKYLGPEDPQLASAVFNLAELYVAKAKYKEAAPLYDRLLTMYEKSAGPEDPKTASALERVGFLAFKNGDKKLAEASLTRALEIYEKSKTPNAKKAAALSLELAELYRINEDKTQAEKMYLHAIELSDKAEESVDPEAVTPVERYICFLNETLPGDEAKAREMAFYESRMDVSKVEKPGASIVKGGVINGKAISKPVPTYPRDAIKANVGGVVTVRILVDETGRVAKAKAICGPEPLRAESEKAALKAKFTPTTLSGMPVKVSGVITYKFSRGGK
jgi:TonB family protein